MKPRVSKQRATFFWHGVLILLPVLVLVAAGLLSLRQDKFLAQHEAADRAQAIADELATKVWSALNRSEVRPVSRPYAFEVDPVGHLLFPRPYSPCPGPILLDPSVLKSKQALLWQKAERAEAEGRDIPSAILANQGFLDSNPPESFAAAALYAQGLLLLKDAQPQVSADCFIRLLQHYPEAIGESGLPLRPLAELKLFELESRSNTLSKFSVSLESLCSNVVCYPTQLSFGILEQLSAQTRSHDESKTIEEWMRRWQEHESSRALFSTASQHFGEHVLGELLVSSSLSSEQEQNSVSVRSNSPPAQTAAPKAPLQRLLWFRPPLRWNPSESTKTSAPKERPSSLLPSEGEQQDWLAFEQGERGSNHWFVCMPESEILADLASVVTDTIRIPDYFGVGIELAGKPLGPRQRGWPAFDLRLWHEVDYFGRNGGGEKKDYSNELATTILASAVKKEGDHEWLQLNIYLTSSPALFKAQRARTFWFGLLVAAAAGAAFVGLATAYRAFRRQLQLAELKGNFVSSVSHELRAPIASVRLMAENLEVGRVVDASKQREYFHFIVQECRRLSALIENVLDFSRIDQGRKQYEFEPTDLAALVTQSVKLMEPYAAERQISIQLQLAMELQAAPQMLADGKALQQALINLIDNALKHSAKGQVITVGLEKDLSIRLWVEDDGEGIPPSEHEKIFERFYRCGSELRRETQGVGIGLSIVKHVVEAHSGRVVVRSVVGQGSRFTIELPLDSGEAKA